jgi:hypothetical protein
LFSAAARFRGGAAAPQGVARAAAVRAARLPACRL